MLNRALQFSVRLPDSKQLASVLVLFAAATMLAAQIVYTAHPEVQFGLTPPDQYGRLSLWIQDRRATELRHLTNGTDREELCIPTAAVARHFDRDIPANARVYVDGVLGGEAIDRSAMYLFLQNYLFPRDIEISLDGRAVFAGDEFQGVPCESTDILRDKGFDFLVVVISPETAVGFPLTQSKAEIK